MGELPLRGAAAGLQKCSGCFLEISRCAGLLDWRNAEAAFGGAPAARGCWGLLDYRHEEAAFGGSFRCAGLLAWSKEEAAFARSPAARGCSNGERKKLLFGEIPLRGAAGLQTTDKRRLLLGELPLRGAAR